MILIILIILLLSHSTSTQSTSSWRLDEYVNWQEPSTIDPKWFYFGDSSRSRLGDDLTACDWDQDGNMDLIFAAPRSYYRAPLNAKVGQIYIKFGPITVPDPSTSPTDYNLEDNIPDIAYLRGDVSGDRFGNQILCRDLNNDTWPDIVVSAPSADVSWPNSTQYNAGIVHIIWGGTNNSNLFFSPGSNISTLNITAFSTTISGADQYDQIGLSPQNGLVIGDFNGDSFPDLLIDSSRSLTASAYILFGPLGNFSYNNINLSEPYPFIRKIVGVGGYSATGFGLSYAVVDLNNDGYDDIVIPASYWDSVYVFFGNPVIDSIPLDVPSLNGTNGYTILLNNYQSPSHFGTGLQGIGDVNGDGFPDLLIGSPYVDASATASGAVFLYFGNNDTLPTKTIDLINGPLDPLKFVMINGTGSSDYLGRRLGFLGDINGDGIEDFSIGCPDFDLPLQSRLGRLYVIFGKNESWTEPTINPNEYLNGTTGYKMTSEITFAQFGYTSIPIGDFNNDSIGDFMVSSVTIHSNTISRAGSVIVVLGRPTCAPGYQFINKTCSPCSPPSTTGIFNVYGSSSTGCVFQPLTCLIGEFIQIIGNSAKCSTCPTSNSSVGSFNFLNPNAFNCTFDIQNQCLSNQFLNCNYSVDEYPWPLDCFCEICSNKSDSLLNPFPNSKSSCDIFKCESGTELQFTGDTPVCVVPLSPFFEILPFAVGGLLVSGLLLYRYRRSSQSNYIYQEFNSIDTNVVNGNESESMPGTLKAVKSLFYINALSLDGGGVKGLFQLSVLEQIEQRLKIPPSKAFHIIGGSSTGGLIALALISGKSITDQQNLFENLSKIFSKRPPKAIRFLKQLFSITLYPSNKFELMLQEVFGTDSLLISNSQNTGSESGSGSGSGSGGQSFNTKFPLGFALASQTDIFPPKPYLFRNYLISSDTIGTTSYGHTVSLNSFKLWEAARATSAAPLLFDEFRKDFNSWADGSLIANNPSIIIYKEARQLYSNCDFGLFLSLGSGQTLSSRQSNSKSLLSWLQTLKNIATNTEQNHSQMTELLSNTTYYRFSPSLPSEIPLDASSKSDLELLHLVSLGYSNYISDRLDSVSNRIIDSWPLLFPSLGEEEFNSQIDLTSITVDEAILQNQFLKQRLKHLKQQRSKLLKDVII